MIMAGENYPDEQRYEYLTKFGIGQPTGLNLPGESSGLLTNFGVGSAYAQHHPVWSGYAVNALQLNNVVATIANKGVKQQQSIIKSTPMPMARPLRPRRAKPPAWWMKRSHRT